VTHDQVEAMTMSRRVAVMMDGALLQVGTPSELYAQPVDLRVARFIGTHPINVYEASLQADGTPVLFGRPLPVQVAPAAGPRVKVAVRPEDLVLDFGPSAPSSDCSLGARLIKLEDHGAEFVLHLRLETEPSQIVLVRGEASLRDRLPQIGDAALTVLFPTTRLKLFDSAGKCIRPMTTMPFSLAAGGETR
ncbi:MAG TPA: ABC transporter ATP-binding protein, partial [Kiloniellaceae bacterium]|nr:ABC transporter ATP-binding protein [Kiloniellaceae bacterium]